MVPSVAALAKAALVTTAVSTGMQVYSSYSQGKARQQQADYNARVQKQQADLMREDSKENRGRMREDAKRRLARLRAMYAGSGLVGATGTPADVFGATAGKLELRIADYASGVERKAQALEQGADLSKWQGKQAGRAGGINALASGISGLSDLGSMGFTFHDKLQKTNAS